MSISCKFTDIKKIRVAKEKWMVDRCSKVEEFERKHDMFYIYMKVGDVAGLYNKKANNILVDSARKKSIIGEREILEIWI